LSCRCIAVHRVRTKCTENRQELSSHNRGCSTPPIIKTDAEKQFRYVGKTGSMKPQRLQAAAHASLPYSQSSSAAPGEPDTNPTEGARPEERAFKAAQPACQTPFRRGRGLYPQPAVSAIRELWKTALALGLGRCAVVYDDGWALASTHFK